MGIQSYLDTLFRIRVRKGPRALISGTAGALVIAMP